MCQAAVALVAPGPAVPPGIQCAVCSVCIYSGALAKRAGASWEKLFSCLCPRHEEETQLYVCVSNLCFAEVTSPNTLLSKASQIAQPRVKRSEVCSAFYGRGLELQDKGCGHREG